LGFCVANTATCTSQGRCFLPRVTFYWRCYPSCLHECPELKRKALSRDVIGKITFRPEALSDLVDASGMPGLRQLESALQLGGTVTHGSRAALIRDTQRSPFQTSMSARSLSCCVSAPNRDPTSKSTQGLEITRRNSLGAGSRSAPVGTPPICSFCPVNHSFTEKFGGVPVQGRSTVGATRAAKFGLTVVFIYERPRCPP